MIGKAWVRRSWFGNYHVEPGTEFDVQFKATVTKIQQRDGAIMVRLELSDPRVPLAELEEWGVKVHEAEVASK